MIIDDVRITNFGVYRGEHNIKLTPPSPSKPVILVGGLNGCGKTTFLDALQLVLYGKMARCSNRGSMAYDTYIRKCINRFAPPEHGAEISLAFHHVIGGKKQYYRVTRRWSVPNGSVKEDVEVYIREDGKPHEVLDTLMSDNWHDHVDMFIPSNISPLFFFDGEKIESLADLEHSKEILRTAIQGLLGLDIVDRLEDDLEILERQNRITQKSEVDRTEVLALEAEIGQHVRLLERHRTDRASLENELSMAQGKVEKLHRDFAAEGGLLYQQKEALEQEQTQIEGGIEHCNEEAQELAAGCLPLQLVRDMLDEVRVMDVQEEARENVNLIVNILQERDHNLQKKLMKEKVDEDIVKEVFRILSEDIRDRVKSAEGVNVLELSRVGRHQLTILLDHDLDQRIPESKNLCVRFRGLDARHVGTKRKLKAVPDEERIANLFMKQEKAKLELIQLQSRVKAIDEEIQRIEFQLDDVKTKRKVILEGEIDGQVEMDSAARIVKHSAKVRQTLLKFKAAITEKHVQRIQYYVLDSFKKLLRKKNLLMDLRIDPLTLEVSLIGQNNHLISPERLSAGERQLLAVSLLWGLARAAGRILPAIIDTPLGRLDSKHRIHLIQRYYPFASHQVMLLSTDAEVTGKYYEELKPYIGHSYTLEYDEDEKTTKIKPGYFGDN